MMSKVCAFSMVITLLIFFELTCAARPGPAFHDVTPANTEHGDAEVEFEESCEGVGDEECLMRRTLAAHVDYIYTQKQKQP
ncbi:hypothetical protein U1Q18_035204 [Sarracenia purpurea var. burkii]